jgi:hypothetical protein
MKDNGGGVRKASALKVPEVSSSEPKGCISLSKTVAFNHLKEDLQKVENIRKAGIKEIEEVIRDASEKIDNKCASLEHFQKAQKKHELAELVLFVGVVSALSGFAAYSATSLFQWLYKRLRKASSKKNFNDEGKARDLDTEGTEGVQGDDFKIKSRRLHSRDWQVAED